MSEEKITREQRRKVRDVKKRSGVIVEVDGAQDKRGLSRRYDVDLAARSCTCPAWRFQKKPITERTCKHLEAALRKEEALQANLNRRDGDG